jgi:hypothetical protein
MAGTSPNLPSGPHVVGTFATREQAEAALDALIARGFASDAISVLTAEGKPVSFPTRGEDLRDEGVRDTAIGATLGGVAGFLIAGPLLLLTGVVVGGAIGLLTALGASQPQAEHLAEQVRSGRYLAVVHTADRDAEAVAILENAGAADVQRLAS